MSDAQIIRVSQVGYGTTGQDVRSDEVYVKLLASFQDRLMQLKNARLSVFIAHATQEAKIIAEGDVPLSLRRLQTIVPYSRPTIIEAHTYLCEHRFLETTDERGPDCEILYRVCSYSWFGTSRDAAAFHPDAEADVPAYSPDEPGGKKSLPPPLDSRSMVAHPTTHRGGKDFSSPKKISSHDDVIRSDQSDHLENHHHDMTAAVEKIFRDAKFEGIAPMRLAERVDTETAHAWAEWIESAPDKYENPHGYAYACLMQDAAALPPTPVKPKKTWWGDEYDKFVRI